jgi:hypothetical protein
LALVDVVKFTVKPSGSIETNEALFVTLPAVSCVISIASVAWPRRA